MTCRRTVALAAAALVLGACSEEPSAEERRAEVVDQLATDLEVAGDGALDGDDARCVAEALADDVGAERFEEVVAAAEDPDAPGDLRDQVVEAFESCDALEPLLDEG